MLFFCTDGPHISPETSATGFYWMGVPSPWQQPRLFIKIYLFYFVYSVDLFAPKSLRLGIIPGRQHDSLSLLEAEICNFPFLLRLRSTR